MLGLSSYFWSIVRSSALMSVQRGGEHSPKPRTMMLKVTSSGCNNVPAPVLCQMPLRWLQLNSPEGRTK